MSESTQMVVVDEQAMSPLTLLHTALEKGVDPDRLGKLMDLAERWEENRASKAFADAITKFQKLCPPIHKSQMAGKSDGRMQYKFASYDDVMYVAGPILADCGIAISFTTDPSEHGLKATCRVRVGTHYEDHTLTVPIPDMRVNGTQQFGAALTYAKRYVLCAALNIVVTNEDDDASSQNGKQAAPQPAQRTAQQQTQQPSQEVKLTERAQEYAAWIKTNPAKEQLSAELVEWNKLSDDDRQQSWLILSRYARGRGWTYDRDNKCFV